MNTKTYIEYEIVTLSENEWDVIAVNPTLEMALESKSYYENEDPDVDSVRIEVYEIVEKDELQFVINRGMKEYISRKLIETIV